MGRRALRTGDLVQPQDRWFAVNLTSKPWTVGSIINSNGMVVVADSFQLGMVLGFSRFPVARIGNVAKLQEFAVVLDCASCKAGWVSLDDIKRVK